jgi:hypothetical protein
MFPDVFAFGPGFVVGLWLRLSGGAVFPAGRLPRVHIGLPLYNIAHSLIVFAVVAAVSSLAARRLVLGLAGWLLHILIDIATHSHDYYATRFLWPVSSFRIDGVPWWTPWVFWSTYAGLAVTYLWLWRKGWLGGAGQPSKAPSASGSCG